MESTSLFHRTVIFGWANNRSCKIRSAGPERLTMQTPAYDTLAPTRIEVFEYKAAISEPIVTSFGST
jgi:hypothetical protein